MQHEPEAKDRFKVVEGRLSAVSCSRCLPCGFQNGGEPNLKENYEHVYIRTNNIENLYQSLLDYKINIHPHNRLYDKPLGQKEFSVFDPDNNLLKFK